MLLNYSNSTREYQLHSIGFTGDKGNFSATHPDKTPANYGLKERATWFKPLLVKKTGDTIDRPEYNTPTCVEFMGPLLADVCNQDRLILNGVDIDINLWPNRDEFRIITLS